MNSYFVLVFRQARTTGVFSKIVFDIDFCTDEVIVIFDIINKRYNNKKATIFSSNHSLNELINKSGIAEKTVDRISEMASGAVMKIEGASLRNTLKNCIF